MPVCSIIAGSCCQCRDSVKRVGDEADIRRKAYELWEFHGRPDGDKTSLMSDPFQLTQLQIRETWSEFFWNLAEHLIQERRSNTSPVVVEVFNNKEPTKVSIEMFDHRAGDIVEFLLCDQEEGHSDEYLKDLGPEGILDKCAGIAGLYNPTRERNRLTLEIGRDDLYDRDNFTVMHEIVAEEVKKWHGDKGALFYNPYITNHVLVYFFESFPETTAYYKSFCESLVYVVAM